MPGLKGGALSRASCNQVTELLIQWSEGDTAARDKLIPLVYSELRFLARQALARERNNHTLSSTALVHEAYLRLIDCSSVHWENKAQFFGLAAHLMRQILVDHARGRKAAKRGGNALTLTLDEAVDLPTSKPPDLIALNDALKNLAELDARQSQIVELRFFGGLTVEDTSNVLGISPATVKREWATARIWLYQAMS